MIKLHGQAGIRSLSVLNPSWADMNGFMGGKVVLIPKTFIAIYCVMPPLRRKFESDRVGGSELVMAS
jgi:hypothetical protein